MFNRIEIESLIDAIDFQFKYLEKRMYDISYDTFIEMKQKHYSLRRILVEMLNKLDK